MASAMARRIASVAGDQHRRFHMMDEGDPKLCAQIRKYWTEIGLTFTSCTSVPWSAVFVSWCVKKAGVTPSQFLFEQSHARFVHDCINNPRGFRGVNITAAAPDLGDIIHGNRNGGTHDFAFARTHKTYNSHSAIVVEIGRDAGGGYALTIGGNEGDAIRATIVRLKPNGFIKQRVENPYISVLKNRM